MPNFIRKVLHPAATTVTTHGKHFHGNHKNTANPHVKTVFRFGDGVVKLFESSQAASSQQI
jgi:hypothetical protein